MTRILKAAGLRGRNKFKLARSVDTLIEALGGGRRGHTQPEIIQSITHSTSRGVTACRAARVFYTLLCTPYRRVFFLPPWWRSGNLFGSLPHGTSSQSNVYRAGTYFSLEEFKAALGLFPCATHFAFFTQPALRQLTAFFINESNQGLKRLTSCAFSLTSPGRWQSTK